MMISPRTPRRTLALAGAVLAAAWFATDPPSLGSAPSQDTQQPGTEFASPIIDLGVVVADLEQSVEFYTDLVGFTEVPGFEVDGEFCKGAGLTDGHPLRVRVLVLDKDQPGTRLKLMQLPGVESKAADNAFVHSQLGFSYLTIRTHSLRPALERLEKAGVRPIADGPVPLPGAPADGPHLAVVRDPDGNLVELIGTR